MSTARLRLDVQTKRSRFAFDEISRDNPFANYLTLLPLHDPFKLCNKQVAQESVTHLTLKQYDIKQFLFLFLALVL